MTRSPKGNDEPVEDPEAQAADRDVLRVTTGSLKLPEGLDAEKGTSRDPINRVVFVILALAIAFIAFVAWLISRTP